MRSGMGGSTGVLRWPAKTKAEVRQQKVIDALAYYDEHRPKRSRTRVIEEIRYRFGIGPKTMRWALLLRVTMEVAQ